MNRSYLWAILLIAGIGVLLSGVTMKVQSMYGTITVADGEVVSCPDSVNPGETFNVTGKIKLRQGYTGGVFRVTVYPQGSITWSSGYVPVTAVTPYYWKDFNIDVTAPSDSEIGSLPIRIGGYLEEETQERRTINSANEKTIQINSGPVTHTLTINKNGQGTTSPSGSCEIEEGYSKTITATAASGWSFDGWTGVVSSNSNEVSVTINEDSMITANFVENFNPDEYTLNTSVEPAGTGSIGIMATTQSLYTFPAGTVLSLEASPITGYEFTQWSGDISGNSNPVTIYMDSNKTATAHFTEVGGGTHTLTTLVTDGEGRITATPDKSEYDDEEDVTLQATPDEGYEFDHWGGDISGSENPKAIMMDSDKTVEAVFTKAPAPKVTLTTYSNPTDGGTINCIGDKTVNKGENITVQAIPNEGYSFDEWTGDASGDYASITVYMDGDKTVTANFSKDEGMLSFLTIDNLLLIIGVCISVTGVIGLLMETRRG